ncbi:MAG: hypothetical protein QNI90_01275 [Dinoroseobacter sp.]|nr:hypothetical protein [Dinoroseobacter sp.]MDJ0992180.1 hypothetical protein [Dinoroseobacter sp.]
MPLRTILLATCATATLAGCNMSGDAQRATVGAAAGTVGAAVVNGNLLAGAAVGAAAGALCNDAGLC